MGKMRTWQLVLVMLLAACTWASMPTSLTPSTLTPADSIAVQPAMTTEPTQEIYIKASLTPGKEEYRAGEEMAIEFRLTNTSQEKIFISIFDQDSWAGYCVFLLPDERINAPFPKPTYLPYIELADHKELIASQIVRLDPGESYVYAYRGFLNKALGQASLVWDYELYWGKTPKEVAQRKQRITTDRAPIVIKPALSEEMFNKALSEVAPLGDRYKWWELQRDPNPYKRAAAAKMLLNEMWKQSIDPRYFDFPEDELRTSLWQLATSDENALVRVMSAWAWLRWSVGTSYQGSQEIIASLVQQLRQAELFTRETAITVCGDIAAMENFFEHPANGEFFLDALLSQIEQENRPEIKRKMLYILFQLLSFDRPGAAKNQERIVDALNWGLHTGDNDLCMQILSHHSQWLTTPRSRPYLVELLRHDGGNNSGDIRQAAEGLLALPETPR